MTKEQIKKYLKEKSIEAVNDYFNGSVNTNAMRCSLFNVLWNLVNTYDKEFDSNEVDYSKITIEALNYIIDTIESRFIKNVDIDDIISTNEDEFMQYDENTTMSISEYVEMKMYWFFADIVDIDKNDTNGD